MRILWIYSKKSFISRSNEKHITTEVNFQFSSRSLCGFWQNRVEIPSKIEMHEITKVVFLFSQKQRQQPGLKSCVRPFSYFIIYLLYKGPILIK
ncbi:unnamed protein product [Paramecium pentaurelia]|uniref:Uncharacterized protein n=1 Tax=Paramecium pentaurelia TaxID=43138 RepID=A0A8S1VTA7_9CILI|nr:unnamed protein product [Paramecium pentaurelia]